MKNKFIKSTIILVIGGIITKIFAMVIRIITTRLIGVNGIGLYMIIMPTFNLFINISTMSYTTAISKLVSEGGHNKKNILFSTCLFSLAFNIILIFLIIILSPFIANNLLHNSNLHYPIMTCAFTLPFITISSIIRGYFFGTEKMFPHVFSNFMEQVIRIILLIFIIPLIINKNIIVIVCFLILFNIASEIVSSIVMLLFMPKSAKINLKVCKFNFNELKDVLEIAIPTTIGRLVSSIGMFLEPIILTTIFLKIGYDNSYIVFEYGIVMGYVLPVITMPEFLSSAIATSILPIISKAYKEKKYSYAKDKLKKAIVFSLIIGIGFSSFIFLFPEFCLKLLFNNITGINYLKFAALVFIVAYPLGPINAAIQGIGLSNKIMISQIIGIAIKLISLISFTFLCKNMNSLLISYFCYFIFALLYQINILRKVFI